jgi:hypothetical protein
MSIATLVLGWFALTSLGIGLIVAFEPLWTHRAEPAPARCGDPHGESRR